MWDWIVFGIRRCKLKQPFPAVEGVREGLKAAYTMGHVGLS